MGKTYQVIEYGSFVREKEVDGYTSLPGTVFDALENFILSNSSGDTDALELMGLSARKGIGRMITARNYVGVVAMKDGTAIEILPKIYSHKQSTEAGTKKLLIDMLRTLRNAPYKILQSTNLNIAEMHIFEIFIRMFIDEVFFIVKRGLKCNYETVRSNGAVFKGKMKFDGQIRYNYAHKERCYVEYDEFNTNCAENKLLKAALVYLYRHTGSSKNKKDIKTLLNCFSEVDISVDYEADFAKVVSDRNTRDYASALRWSRVFLKGKSFTSFSGSEVAFALLFPMETLFESYIAVQLRRILPASEYRVSVQDRTYYLFDKPERKFLLKPDLVIEEKASNNTYIIDTKWKVLSEAKRNYGISQADMYQMYAYQKKYSAESVTLIYPLAEKVPLDNEIEFYDQDGAVVKVKFVDLFDVKNSLEKVAAELLPHVNQKIV